MTTLTYIIKVDVVQRKLEEIKSTNKQCEDENYNHSMGNFFQLPNYMSRHKLIKSWHIEDHMPHLPLYTNSIYVLREIKRKIRSVNLSNIISSQVDQHYVLCTLFLVMQKLIFQHIIFLRCLTSPNSPC